MEPSELRARFRPWLRSMLLPFIAVGITTIPALVVPIAGIFVALWGLAYCATYCVACGVVGFVYIGTGGKGSADGVREYLIAFLALAPIAVGFIGLIGSALYGTPESGWASSMNVVAFTMIVNAIQAVVTWIAGAVALMRTSRDPAEAYNRTLPVAGPRAARAAGPRTRGRRPAPVAQAALPETGRPSHARQRGSPIFTPARGGRRGSGGAPPAGRGAGPDTSAARILPGRAG